MPNTEQLACQTFAKVMEHCGSLEIQQKLDYLTDLASMIAEHTEECLLRTPDTIELDARKTPDNMLRFARYYIS